VATALIVALKNDLHECFQKLNDHWPKYATAHGSYFKENVVNRCKVTYFCAINQFQEL
jgi:hypothetical protein